MKISWVCFSFLSFLLFDGVNSKIGVEDFLHRVIGVGKALEKCSPNDDGIKIGTSIPGVSLILTEDLYIKLRNATNIEVDADTEPDLPSFVDHFGVKHNWTDPEDGWTTNRRNNFVVTYRNSILQQDVMPSFSKTGYKLTKIPDELYKFILENRLVDELYDDECHALFNCKKVLRFEAIAETPMGNRKRKFIATFNKTFAAMMEWKDPALATKKIKEHLKPILEEWIGGDIPLKYATHYGVRRYFNGSILNMHLDKPTTHVVSAILQIDQDVVEDWPLAFIDLKSRKKKITLRPGDMLLYESAKALHGRPYPFNGNFFDNLFVHYKPANRWYTLEDFPNQKPMEGLVPITLKDIRRKEQ